MTNHELMGQRRRRLVERIALGMPRILSRDIQVEVGYVSKAVFKFDLRNLEILKIKRRWMVWMYNYTHTRTLKRIEAVKVDISNFHCCGWNWPKGSGEFSGWSNDGFSGVCESIGF